MKSALFLGLFFIVEYLLSLFALQNILLSSVVLLLKLVTPFALYYLLRQIRDRFLDGVITRLQAFTFGLQLVMFASLPEAAVIYIYNQFIHPEAMAEAMQTTVDQLEKFQAIVGQQYLSDQTIDLYREAGIPSAIETAGSMMANDVFYAIFLLLFIAPIVHRKATALQ